MFAVFSQHEMRPIKKSGSKKDEDVAKNQAA
jgi:hypothetical protein